MKNIMLPILILGLLNIVPATAGDDAGDGEAPKESTENKEKCDKESKGKFLFVIPDSDFQDNELTMPMEKLREAGYETVVASPTKGTCEGLAGLEVESNVELSDVDVKDYLGMSIAGGPGTVDTLWDNETLEKLVKQFDRKKKIVAAISQAPVVLARARIIRHKTVTAMKTDQIMKEIKRATADYQMTGVMTHENILTSSGPHMAKYYSDALLRMLEDKT